MKNDSPNRNFPIFVIWQDLHRRSAGTAKLKIKEMGSHYLFISLYVWLEELL
jgi:hypothetical protein